MDEGTHARRVGRFTVQCTLFHRHSTPTRTWRPLSGATNASVGKLWRPNSTLPSILFRRLSRPPTTPPVELERVFHFLLIIVFRLQQIKIQCIPLIRIQFDRVQQQTLAIDICAHSQSNKARDMEVVMTL